MNRKEKTGFVGSIAAITMFAGCTVSPLFDDVECDPKIDKWAAPQCRDASTDPGPETDAGTDANTDTDASSAVSEIPPLQPEDWKVCPGSCLPEPSDTSAGSWPNDPLLVWMGPLSEMPAECPPEAPFMKWKRAFDGNGFPMDPGPGFALACRAFRRVEVRNEGPQALVNLLRQTRSVVL